MRWSGWASGWNCGWRPRAAAATGTIAAVLEALESGVRPNWLLVYDNAAQPLELQRYLPKCPPGGHIIITSRLQNWPGYMEADSVEVSPFTAEEAVSFLRRRVPALAATAIGHDEMTRAGQRSGRLAAALGHLPIAIEHAAAYLAETGQSVERLPHPVRRERASAAQRATLGFPRRRSPVPGRCRPQCSPLTPSTCSTYARSFLRSRSRPNCSCRTPRRSAARPGWASSCVLAPVPRRGRPAAPAVAGQGRRCPRPDPDAPGGTGRHQGSAAAEPARGVPRLPGGRGQPAGRVESGQSRPGRQRR